MNTFTYETFNSEIEAKNRAKELKKRKYTLSWNDFWKCYILSYNKTK